MKILYRYVLGHVTPVVKSVFSGLHWNNNNYFLHMALIVPKITIFMHVHGVSVLMESLLQASIYQHSSVFVYEVDVLFTIDHCKDKLTSSLIKGKLF